MASIGNICRDCETAINATLDLNATSSRGLPVSFAATKGASFTTISNGRATFSAIGEVTIEASQDGNSGGFVPFTSTVARTFRVKRPADFVI